MSCAEFFAETVNRARSETVAAAANEAPQRFDGGGAHVIIPIERAVHLDERRESGFTAPRCRCRDERGDAHGEIGIVTLDVILQKLRDQVKLDRLR